MKKINANGYKNINNVEYRLFADYSTKDRAIEEFFEDFDKPYGITTNVIGYIVDDDGENVGVIEESYVDSGSVDYFYTAF